MTASFSPILVSRLQKAATDNGFDQGSEPDGMWSRFSSTQCPLFIWLGSTPDGAFSAALSQENVLRALSGQGSVLVGVKLPVGAAGAYTVPDIPTLHRLLRRALQLSRALPNELLDSFKKKVAMLPRTTEAERLVVQRVGQDIFRDGLLDFWEGRCAVTGLAVPELLRASHIKPWSVCETDAERLDVFNGILLAPHLDAVFDGGLVTVADDGLLVVSEALDADARTVLGLQQPLRVHSLTDGHRGYLPWHRAQVFQHRVEGGARRDADRVNQDQ